MFVAPLERKPYYFRAGRACYPETTQTNMQHSPASTLQLLDPSRTYEVCSQEHKVIEMVGYDVARRYAEAGVVEGIGSERKIKALRLRVQPEDALAAIQKAPTAVESSGCINSDASKTSYRENVNGVRVWQHIPARCRGFRGVLAT